MLSKMSKSLSQELHSELSHTCKTEDLNESDAEIYISTWYIKLCEFPWQGISLS